MPEQQLMNYVKQQLNAGYTPEDIRNALLQAGYTEQQVEEAISTATKPAAAPAKAEEPSEHISAAWWLLPIFLSWLGGLIAYLVLKDRNHKTAFHMLLLGIIITVVFVVIWAIIVMWVITTTPPVIYF